ncbi:MAG TPA: APC family permease [Candidatus Micrarchaeia archaeon]|nr:APC family permease [Candidatus Micrarchaeia archaeon]
MSGGPEPARPPRRPQGLAAGSLRFLGSTAISVGIQAPTAGIVFLPALMAGIVGTRGPLAFALALAAMLPVAYVFGMFSSEFSTAGSVYAFNGAALGPTVGFLSGWMLLATYTLYASATVAGTTNVARALLGSAGIHPPWVAVAVVLLVAGWTISHRAVRVSAGWILALEAVALTLVAVIGVLVVVRGGYHGHASLAAPFDPAGLTVNLLVLGMVFAYTGFSGFEGAATCGEEVRRPRRVIPHAILVSLLVGGGAYVFGSWVETIAFPSARVLAGHSVPLVAVARLYLSPDAATAVNVAALVSSFGAQLATLNAASRLLFALSRDGFITSRLATVHPRHRSPARAVAVVAAVALAGVLALAGTSPLAAFTATATWGADLIVGVYGLTTLAAATYLIRRRRRPFGIAVSLVGLAVLGLILEQTVVPLPAFPFDLLLGLAGASVAVGLAIPLAFPGYRHHLAQSPLFRPQQERRRLAVDAAIGVE